MDRLNTRRIQDRELTRYEGHLNLPKVGILGQQRLKQASVLCIGIGSLGCPVVSYLAAAGIGKIGLVDFDIVEESNFQRQILFRTVDIGEKKSTIAKRSLEMLNPYVSFEAYPVKLTADWIEKLFPKYDIIVDATDNFSSRLTINSGCVKYKKPLISASVYQFEGQISVFNHKDGPCYECLFPITEKEILNEEKCSSIGIFSTLTGIVGTIQANEVLKLIIGLDESLSGQLLLIDSTSLNVQKLNFSKNPLCRQCSGTKSTQSVNLNIKNSEIQEPQAQYGLNPNEVWNLIQSDQKALLLDLRPNNETTSIRIPGSRKVMLAEVLDQAIEGRFLEKTLILYCSAELRARRATESLRGSGISAHYLMGGMHKWVSENKPVEQVEDDE